MFPKIAAQLAKYMPSSLSVSPRREAEYAAERERAASQRFAFDSRSNDHPELSIENMFPKIAARLKVG